MSTPADVLNGLPDTGMGRRCGRDAMLLSALSVPWMILRSVSFMKEGRSAASIRPEGNQ